MSTRSRWFLACVLLCCAAALRAQTPDATQSTATAPAGTVTGEITVTATRLPESVLTVPADITVITGEELEARGVHDIAGALELVPGVSVAPGGEAGPAGFVPEIWGLREVDAFLLVVDGVPWGGAFNPAVTALSLENVERIEVMRGASPVMYGATAFSGVIQVIHRAAGEGARNGRAWVGSRSSGGAAASFASSGGSVKQSLNVDAETLGFADDRAGADRGHVLYRAGGGGMGGSWRFDADALLNRQDPNSPHARGNAVTILDPRIPLDANHNPTDARVDEDRFALTGGFDRPLGSGNWSSTLSYTHTSRDTTRGFIRRDDISNDPDVEADGFRQSFDLADVYLDSHLAFEPSLSLSWIVGLDWLYGNGSQDSDNFEYEIGLDGSDAPNSHSLHVDEETHSDDTRSFLGLYAQGTWRPTPRFEGIAGIRVSDTREDLEGEVVAREGDLPGEGEEEGGSESKSHTRTSGVLGGSFLLFGNGETYVRLFADYRNTFKPAAFDFGPEGETEILEPETSESYEVGLKGRAYLGPVSAVHWQVTAFDMRLENLLLPQDAGLINGGKQRYKGVEVEAAWLLAHDLTWEGSAAWHDPKFEDFVQDFDGVPTQLAGNRQELAAKRLWSTGLVYAPAVGFRAHATVEWVGDRFLNRRNTVLAPSYTEWGAGLGYRFDRWEVRLDGENLGDERPAVSESEIGEAQFYRMPARDVRLSIAARF